METLTTDEEMHLEEALAVLENLILTAVWDGKTRHLLRPSRSMIVPETIIEQARETLKANNYKHYAS